MSSPSVKSALEHICDVLEDPVYPLIFAQAGIQFIKDLWVFNIVELKDIKVVSSELSGKKATYSLSLVQYGKLQRLLEWFDLQGPYDDELWFKITKEDLKKTYFKPKSTGVTNKPMSYVSNDILAGVRRNLTDYPKLREDKMWLSYNRTVLALAASQNLSEVFDVNYVPSADKAPEFKRKNVSVYTMFIYSLTTAKAKVAC